MNAGHVAVAIKQGGACTMAAYKISFLNASGQAIGTKSFTATSNYDAIQAAAQMAAHA